MNRLIQPVETGNQTSDAVNPSLEYGEVIDLHPVYAAMAQAREAAEANGTEPADVLWDPAWPDLPVDNDDYWNDLVERNWETLSRWHAMSLWASQKGKLLHFKVEAGGETATAIEMPTPEIGMSVLQQAVYYAGRGWPVFPCNPTDKRPLISNGFYSATTDEDQIRAWWRRWPNAMIGVRMGVTSGVWAIDPDASKDGSPDGVANWAELVAKHGGIPHTHAHNTPNGGQHLLFKWRDDRPVTNREGGLRGLGINVRGEGGYIIVTHVMSLPKLVQELIAVSAQLTELRAVMLSAVGERTKIEATQAQVDQNIGSRRAEIAGITTQLNQLSWISEVEPRRAHAIAELERLQSQRAVLSQEFASMQQRETSLREAIDKAEDELNVTNDQVVELAENERALRSLWDISADWSTIRDLGPILQAQVAEQGTAKAKAVSEVEASRALLGGLETEIADISEAIRRSDENRAEFQELLASLESHVAGNDCPLCGQEYHSHHELIVRIRDKSAQDPLSEVRNSLANKRTVQLEAQSRYAAARRVLQTSETQFAEAERVNEIHRQRIQAILAQGAEVGFALDAPDFVADAIASAAGQAKAELAARLERAKEKTQAIDQTRAMLASATSTMKRRQEEIVRTDTLLERQRIELGRLQADSRYSEALITSTIEARNEGKSVLEQALSAQSVQLSSVEAEQARLKREITEVARRITGLYQDSRLNAHIERGLKSADIVAKVFLGERTKSFRAADTRRREGPYPRGVRRRRRHSVSAARAGLRDGARVRERFRLGRTRGLLSIRRDRDHFDCPFLQQEL
jgi:hypothetical protein